MTRCLLHSQISRENLELQRLNGSQVSMAMDLHLPNKGPITLKVKDRSDTARRHQLARQTKIEDADDIAEELRKAAAAASSHRSSSPKLPGRLSHCTLVWRQITKNSNGSTLRWLQRLIPYQTGELWGPS